MRSVFVTGMIISESLLVHLIQLAHTGRRRGVTRVQHEFVDETVDLGHAEVRCHLQVVDEALCDRLQMRQLQWVNSTCTGGRIDTNTVLKRSIDELFVKLVGFD